MLMLRLERAPPIPEEPTMDFNSRLQRLFHSETLTDWADRRILWGWMIALVIGLLIWTAISATPA